MTSAFGTYTMSAFCVHSKMILYNWYSTGEDEFNNPMAKAFRVKLFRDVVIEDCRSWRRRWLSKLVSGIVNISPFVPRSNGILALKKSTTKNKNKNKQTNKQNQTPKRAYLIINPNYSSYFSLTLEWEHTYKNNNNNRIERRNSRLFFYFFFLNNLLTAPRTVSNTYAQVARAQSCANHVPHTSSAFHVQHVVCHVERRDSSFIKFDRDESAFILDLFYWLKPIGWWIKLSPEIRATETDLTLLGHYRPLYVVSIDLKWGSTQQMAMLKDTLADLPKRSPHSIKW